MTIQQLRYFLALCEDLNYTHTAGRMYLSRQALRLSIAALEEELCGKLFVNNRNHLALTEKGERFRAQAAPVVQQFDALCQQAYQKIQCAPQKSLHCRGKRLGKMCRCGGRSTGLRYGVNQRRRIENRESQHKRDRSEK